MNIEKLSTRYAEGSATVVANEVTVTPTDALWYGNVWGDDRFFLPSQPLVPPQRIEAVNEDGTLTLAYPWPGASATEEPYEIRYVGIIERSTAQTRKVLEQLGEVSAYYDVQVDTLEDRDAFDARPAGFRVLVSDIGDGRAAIYSKASSVEADWTDPAMFSGPIGDTPDVTVGTVTTGDPGTDADVTATPVEGGVELDFTIPAGEGFSAEGDYDSGTAYAKGDVVQQMGSSWIALQPTTGNAPPSLPTTSNAYWQLLARAGIDGAGTVTAVAAGQGVSVDDTDPTEPVVSLDIMGESVKTANYTLVAADYGGTFIADDTDPIEFAFEAAATLGAKWWVIVKNIGAGDLTLAPDGSETIDGLSELVLKTGQSRLVTCNGTGLRALFEGGGGGGDDVPTVNPNDMMLALLAAEQKNVRIHGAILADPFADQAGIDPEESTGLTYDAELTAFRPAEEGGGQISQGAGTAIGNLILEGGLAKIFDGVTVEGTGSGECARLTNSPLDGWAGKDWGDGNSRVVRAAKLYAPTSHGVSRDTDNTPRSVDARLEGSQNNADWDVLDTQATGTAGSTITEFETEDTTGYRYHRIVIPSYDSNSDKYAAEIEFFEAEELSAGVLVSEIYDVATPPDTLAAAIQILENEEIDINDDIVVSLSRDGGETFTAANLSLMVEVGEEKIYSATGVDVSAQPSGTDLVFKVEVAAKDVLLLGFAMLPGG